MTHFGALIGAFVGFLFAQLPEFIEMLKDHFAHRRDLECKQQEMDAAAQGYQYTIHEQSEALAAQAEQLEALQKQADDAAADADFDNHIALQFLRSSVRPLITYGFFALFATVALFSLHHGLVVEHMSVKDIFPIIWDGDTEDLFAAVIAFWFGSRANPINRPRREDARPPSGEVTSTLTGTNRIVGE